MEYAGYHEFSPETRGERTSRSPLIMLAPFRNFGDLRQWRRVQHIARKARIQMTSTRIVRQRDVPGLLGISRSTLANWLNQHSPYYKDEFPAKVYLSVRSIGFRSCDLEAWIARNMEGHKSTR
ncbi:AlpA family phage regulatory protein [Ottowia beijingensis]|uniref:AlpA family phage regulatory protein n=1 Tax=Ottowia beijingensis TaxID=1207057 RepID=A0A853ILK4_9BURK|nr:AlpA family phage regulatory protein [Ottowia beijingensis]